jgi:glycerol-3-phosphate dehydrogenase
VLSVVGGKWTTFRALSEHVANEVLALLGRGRTVNTADLPIGGGRGYPVDEAGVRAWIAGRTGPGVDPQRAETLLARYGTRAEEVLAFLAQGQDTLLRSTAELSVRELAWMARHEHVSHVADVLIRRTSLAFRGLVTAELGHEIAAHLAPHLGWDAHQTQQEAEAALSLLAERHSLDLATTGALQ